MTAPLSFRETFMGGGRFPIYSASPSTCLYRFYEKDRTLLSLTLFAPLLFAGSDKAHEHGRGSFKNKIGLQLWSLRDLTKEDPEVALDLVKAWGSSS
ncbi:hypothetical protein QEH57_22505 [Pelagicoccus sp. SDUM812005]|nr:hypothetical protein [Pelagicoccus sp. SDUM812005]